MSIADTAEYQLEQLANAMTEALVEAEESGWTNADYRRGFEAALDRIAFAMSLTVKKRTEYTY